MSNDENGSMESSHVEIGEGTILIGKRHMFLHDEEAGEVEEIQDRGRVAVRWDSGYSNYSVGSFLGLLREGYFEVSD